MCFGKPDLEEWILVDVLVVVLVNFLICVFQLTPTSTMNLEVIYVLPRLRDF